jgi:hypothetical protein
LFHAASVEQSATVTVQNNTTAYEAGEQLTDASLYPLRNASDPRLVATAQVDNGDLRALKVTLTYSAAILTDLRAPFFNRTVVLASIDDPQSTAQVTTDVPVTQILDQREQLQSEFGPGTRVSTTIATKTIFEYQTPQGQVLTRTVETGGEVVPIGNLYTFPNGQDRVTIETSPPTETPDALSDMVLYGFGLAGLCAVVLGIAVAVSTRYIDPTEVALTIQWVKFRAWVTEVESYTPQGDVNTVQVTSLTDLVNLAIDTNRRVLYHKPIQEYLVVEGATMYKYVPEGRGESGSTELFGMDELDLDMSRLSASPPPDALVPDQKDLFPGETDDK